MKLQFIHLKEAPTPLHAIDNHLIWQMWNEIQILKLALKQTLDHENQDMSCNCDQKPCVRLQLRSLIEE